MLPDRDFVLVAAGGGLRGWRASVNMFRDDSRDPRVGGDRVQLYSSYGHHDGEPYYTIAVDVNRDALTRPIPSAHPREMLLVSGSRSELLSAAGQALHVPETRGRIEAKFLISSISVHAEQFFTSHGALYRRPSGISSTGNFRGSRSTGAC